MKALQLTPGVPELLPIARATATAQSIVVYLAEKSRHRNSTDLKRLKYDMYHEGVYIDDHDYHSFWEQLDKAGTVGHLIRATTIEEPVLENGKAVLKDGKPVINKIHKSAKFSWTFSVKIVGQEMLRALKGAGIDPMKHANVSLQQLEATAGKAVAKVVASKDEKVKASVQISKGAAKVFVPHGFSKADADAISKKLFAMAK